MTFKEIIESRRHECIEDANDCGFIHHVWLSTEQLEAGLNNGMKVWLGDREFKPGGGVNYLRYFHNMGDSWMFAFEDPQMAMLFKLSWS